MLKKLASQLILHFNGRYYQSIPPDTLSVLQALLTITEFAKIKMFALQVPLPGGAEIDKSLTINLTFKTFYNFLELLYIKEG